jgi:hypothetical protein
VNHRNQLGDLFAARGYTLAVEVGVQRGEFADIILTRWSGRLIMVDRWMHVDGYQDISNVADDTHLSYMRDAMAVCERHHGRGTCVRSTSLDAAATFENQSLDAVYIDADHSRQGVLADLQAWVPKVRIGGVVAGHDYLDGVLPQGVFGVKSAVFDFFGREPDMVTSEPWPTWLYEVTQ